MAKKIIPTKTPMAEQPPDERIHNYEEVPRGYTAEQAIAEAQRCIQCNKPGCLDGCPVNINVRGFFEIDRRSGLHGAINLIKTNALPAVTGRVCPGIPVRRLFALSKKFESVAIYWLERHADWKLPRVNWPSATAAADRQRSPSSALAPPA